MLSEWEVKGNTVQEWYLQIACWVLGHRSGTSTVPACVVSVLELCTLNLHWCTASYKWMLSSCPLLSWLHVTYWDFTKYAAYLWKCGRHCIVQVTSFLSHFGQCLKNLQNSISPTKGQAQLMCLNAINESKFRKKAQWLQPPLDTICCSTFSHSHYKAAQPLVPFSLPHPQLHIAIHITAKFSAKALLNLALFLSASSSLWYMDLQEIFKNMQCGNLLTYAVNSSFHLRM